MHLMHKMQLLPINFLFNFIGKAVLTVSNKILNLFSWLKSVIMILNTPQGQSSDTKWCHFYRIIFLEIEVHFKIFKPLQVVLLQRITSN